MFSQNKKVDNGICNIQEHIVLGSDVSEAPITVPNSNTLPNIPLNCSPYSYQSRYSFETQTSTSNNGSETEYSIKDELQTELRYACSRKTRSTEIATNSVPLTPVSYHPVVPEIPTPSPMSTVRPWRLNEVVSNCATVSNRLDIELDESRQRLYVDTRRPRPFRRSYVTNRDNITSFSNSENVHEEDAIIRNSQESFQNFHSISSHQPRSLQVLNIVA